MNKRDLRLEKYDISNKRYKELCGFCEQYPEWKQFLANKNGEPGSPVITDMPKAQGNSDTVGNLAVKRVEYAEKCKMIEDCAEMTDKDFSKFIIKNVCYEVPIHYLQTEGLYCSDRTFYRIRRKFYYNLDKVKK